MVYLDYNATTPADDAVIARMMPYFGIHFGNSASRDHGYGWDAADAVEEARWSVASAINALPSEIMFTSCATESVHLALSTYVRSGLGVLTCTTEHPAVLSACRAAADGERPNVSYLGVDRSGRIDLAECARVLERMRPRVVAVALANNEIGTLQSMPEVAGLAHAAGAVVFCDITQGLGKVSIDVRRDGIDMAACSAHKIYGPKGAGALFMRTADAPIEFEPMFRGGSQEWGRRAGTANVPGIVGFGEACRMLDASWEAEAERIRLLRDDLEDGILSQVSQTWLNGDDAHRLGNTSNIGFQGIDARTLIRAMHDVAVSTRSACASGDGGPSHVLKAIGLSDEDAYSCVRFSLGRFTTHEEIDYAIDKVVASAWQLRRGKGT